ncbi:hypothetical protein EV361DRAFT_873647 [Lentinula raphanica]|nr:hypothetical protein EV361DRAFT_873647 [Lentinula raphanica]
MEAEILSTGIIDNDVLAFVTKWKSVVLELLNASHHVNFATYITIFTNFLPHGDVYSDIVSRARFHINHPYAYPDQPIDYNLFLYFADEVLQASQDNDRRVLQNKNAHAKNNNQRNGNSKGNNRSNGKDGGGTINSGLGTKDGGGTNSKDGNGSNHSSINSKMNVAHVAAPVPVPETRVVTSVPVVTTASSSSSSNDISRSAYNVQNSLKPLAASANLLDDLFTSDPITFASIISHGSTLLDSACTYHIIKDRAHFHSYNLEGALSVTTANSGSLKTLASGTPMVTILSLRFDTA